VLASHAASVRTSFSRSANSTQSASSRIIVVGDQFPVLVRNPGERERDLQHENIFVLGPTSMGKSFVA
jgi:hypothetical protein